MCNIYIYIYIYIRNGSGNGVCLRYMTTWCHLMPPMENWWFTSGFVGHFPVCFPIKPVTGLDKCPFLGVSLHHQNKYRLEMKYHHCGKANAVTILEVHFTSSKSQWYGQCHSHLKPDGDYGIESTTLVGGSPRESNSLLTLVSRSPN